MTLRRASALIDHKVRATDGDVGLIDDIYLDSLTWEVRYLVVDGGDWFDGRRLLLSTAALEEPRWDSNITPAALSREEIAGAPAVAATLPLSWTAEQQLADYYGWPISSQPEAGEPLAEAGNKYLHSVQRLLGFRALAEDGGVGEVADLVINDENWRIFYLILDTGGGLRQRRQVLLAASWVSQIEWDEGQVHLELARELIEDSPPFDPMDLIERDYEERLYTHFDRPAYWIDDQE